MKNYHATVLVVVLGMLAGCANPSQEATTTNEPKVASTNTRSISASRTPQLSVTRDDSPYEHQQITPEEWTTFTSESAGVKFGLIEDIAIANDDAVWMISAYGLIKYQNGKWQQFIPDQKVTYANRLAVSKQNVVWMDALDETQKFNRLLRFDGKSWEYYKIPFLTPENEYENERIDNFTVTSDEKVWVSSGENIYVFDGKKTWEIYKNKSGFLAESPNKELWLRSDDRLWRFHNNTWEATPYIEDRGPHGGEIACNWTWFKFAQNGTMWLTGNRQDVRILSNGERQAYNDPDVAVCFDITDRVVSANGDLWVLRGWEHDIIHFTGEKWIKLKINIKNTLLSMAETPNGNFWIGGASGEVYFYHPKH